MKHITALLLLVLIATTSCHKSHSPQPQPGNSFPVNGVTGIRLKLAYDSAGIIQPLKYVTWTFSGTNPLTATPSDTTYFGTVDMFFNGHNATRLTYSKHSYYADTFNVFYNSKNLPDTIITNNALSFVMGRWAYLVEYDDTLISKITAIGSNGLPYDTFNWSRPRDIHNYNYSGQDIASQTLWDAGSNTSSSYAYTTGSIKNNLSGCMPLYLLIEFISSIPAGFGGGTEFPDQLPLYMSSRAIVSQTGTPNAFNYITDSKGRIAARIAPGVYTFDTTTFYY